MLCLQLHRCLLLVHLSELGALLTKGCLVLHEQSRGTRRPQLCTVFGGTGMGLDRKKPCTAVPGHMSRQFGATFLALQRLHVYPRRYEFVGWPQSLAKRCGRRKGGLAIEDVDGVSSFAFVAIVFEMQRPTQTHLSLQSISPRLRSSVLPLSIALAASPMALLWLMVFSVLSCSCCVPTRGRC